MFAKETLNSNMRVFLPIILLSVGQAIVLLGGGIDISVGGVVSIVNTVLATRVGLDGSPEKMWQYIFVSLFAGLLAGAINGFFVSYLRLQPIITTYATSFLYAGFALFCRVRAVFTPASRRCIATHRLSCHLRLMWLPSFVDLDLYQLHTLWKIFVCRGRQGTSGV
jgi:ribose/xylose/arabinose/galactoside ABC-type transport system permease subunit